MKRRVNLYAASLLPERARLTLSRLLIASVSLLVLLVLTGAVLQYHASELNGQLSAARAELNAHNADLSRVTAQLQARQPRAGLVAEVEMARKRLDSFSRLAQVLDRDALLTQPGFSNLMADLATSADNQVWLQRFQLAQNQVLLSGQARRAAAVPAWLDKLGQQPSLQGRAVSQLSIQGEAGKPVHFTAGHGLAEPKGQ